MDSARGITTVIDAGARYGMHPSWRAFGGELRYLAFEPDVDEVARLRQVVGRADVEFVPTALAKESSTRNLHITKHRGYCSFLEPDLESDWFKRYRPGEGIVERVVPVPTQSIDDFAGSRGIDVDFLKVDTEGTEMDVIEGGQAQIAGNILAIRAGVYFQRCYKGQPLFSDIHAYLLKRGFFLLNFDYFGRGVPRNSFFRKPDPLSMDDRRYGTLVSTDAVWLKEYPRICARFKNGRALPEAILKYAYFCMLNHAPDVGIDTLQKFVSDHDNPFDEATRGSALYASLRRACAAFLGEWRVYPDEQWELARMTFQSIFGAELPSGSKFWEAIQVL